MTSPIVLLTDFGNRDGFVGIMKGVIASIAPKTEVIDLSHDIPFADIQAGAFVLRNAIGHFPSGSIFVAVVDPGVGGSRRTLIAKSGSHIFIGPDNGILSWAMARLGGGEIRLLKNPAYRNRHVSRTFHGRDIFAPAAAHISKGAPFSRFGPLLEDPVELRWPEPILSKGQARGEIVQFDTFGNAYTSIPENRDTERLTRVRIGRRILPVVSHYGEVQIGNPAALFGSSGLLEIAVNQGNAQKQLGLKLWQMAHLME